MNLQMSCVFVVLYFLFPCILNAVFCFESLLTQSRAHYGRLSQEIVQLEGAVSTDSPSSCVQLLAYAFANSAPHQWTSTMIASSGILERNLVSSLVNGQYTWLGNFDECLALSDLSVNGSAATFTGKYCMAVYRSSVVPAKGGTTKYTQIMFNKWASISDKLPIVASLCVPSVCSQAELELLINQYFEKYLHSSQLKVNYCQEKRESVSRMGLFTIIKFILYLAIGFSCLSTLWLNFLNCAAPQIVRCFDLSENLHTIFRQKEGNSEEEVDFRFFAGLKVLLLMIIVGLHSFGRLNVVMFSPLATSDNFPWYHLKLFEDKRLGRQRMNRIVFTQGLFLLLSSFTSTYHIISKLGKIPTGAPFLILTRYATLLPSILATLGLTILAQHLGSGPLFHFSLTDPYVRPCQEYAWTHLLLINNWWTMDKMCGINLWFLPVNFQLFIVLAFTLQLYQRRSTITKISLLLCALLSLLPVFFVYLRWAQIPSPYHFYELDKTYPTEYNDIRLIYTLPFLYAAPYFLAALFAIWFIEQKKKKNAPNGVSFWEGKTHWSTLLFLGTFEFINVLPWPSIPINGDDLSSSVTYTAGIILLDLLFILITLLWIYTLLVCKDSAVKRFLSSPFFLPFSRLSLGIYLLNLLVIWFNVHQIRAPQRLNGLSIFQGIFSDYFQSFLLALFMALFFELPCTNLLALLFNAKKTEIEMKKAN